MKEEKRMEQRTVQKTTYHLQVYRLIKQDILSGKIKCGERINEYNLAKEFGVSRSPVREAVRMLESDGLLVPCQNGTRVNPLEGQSICEIYQARMVLESFAARDCVGRIKQAELLLLERCIQDSREAHVSGAINKVIEANTCFHDQIVSYCPNTVIQGMIAKQRDLSLLARRKEFECYHKREDDYLSEHKSILSAIEKGDAQEVENQMRQHIAHDLAFYQQQLLNQ